MSTASTACRRADWERIFGHFKQQCDAEHKEVVALGGLHIIGTERHEARRIDNQLRGRAGRQGDPGSSRFYLSLEDDLMRIFGSDRIAGPDAAPRHGRGRAHRARHGDRAIERAQKQVEAQNFSVRKHLLEYDDVMNKQRESIYTLRREILEGKVHVDGGASVDRHARLRDDHGRGRCSTTRSDLFAGKEMDAEDWDVAALQRELDAALRARPTGDYRGIGLRPAERRRDRATRSGTRVQAKLRGEGTDRPAPTILRARRARHHAADRRPAVEGPPLLARPPEGRHRPARLRPARSAGRVQEGKLRALPGHERPRRRGDRALPVVAAARRRRGERRRPMAPVRPPRRAGRRSATTTRPRSRRPAFAPRPRPRRAAGRRPCRAARRPRRASAATMRPSRPCGATSRRSAATIRARAAAARNTRSAMGQRKP